MVTGLTGKVYPQVSKIVHHCIGLHPVCFGDKQNIFSAVNDLVDVKMNGLNMVRLYVTRTIIPRIDTHIIYAIRCQYKQIPATFDVVYTLSKLGIESLEMLFSDRSDILVNQNEINLACLGSIATNNVQKGIVFNVRHSGITVNYFSARDGKNKLPTDWIFPSFTKA